MLVKADPRRAVLKAGVRILAEPGEFGANAPSLNGRIDLSQAEAIDAINAKMNMRCSWSASFSGKRVEGDP